MFDNIGAKIKSLATTTTAIGIIFSIIIAIIITVSTNGDLAIIGILFLIVGSLIAWLSSLVLYGFGQLVENSDKLVNNSNN